VSSLYKVIKKKRNLRRLSAVWILLVAIELFCPAFCDEPAFAAEVNSPRSEVSFSVDDADKTSGQTFVSADEDQNICRQDKSVCNDECLCHATAIPSLNFAVSKETFTSKERLPFTYGEPVFNSLPPPYQPPKNS
jgi:hypothetical protein